MTQHIPDNIVETILQIASHFPQGASLQDFSQALASALPKRTLQRYIANLTENGQLKVSGRARGRRYFLSTTESENVTLTIPTSTAPLAAPQHEKSIPLSPTALSIEAHVRQPIQARRPVNYNRDFLDKYRPNETYYLPESLRKHLYEIGKSPDGERPAGTYARQIMNRLLIDLSWNSSRLEGNTYSLLETERLLELGEAQEGKNYKEAQMILNHKAAIEFMVESAEYLRFNRMIICNIHGILSDNLLNNQRACGSLRTEAVGIGKSVYQPIAMPQLISEYFEQILDTAEAIHDPFEQSFFAMVHLPYLQPFLDVNKRVSRLAANIPLIRENLCPLSFVDVPQETYVSGLLGVYELNRIELLREVFVWAYERSSALYSTTRQELGEPDLFRMRYRNLITSLMQEIVRGCKDKQAAVASIKQKALETVQENDRARFLEVVETELMSLHKGNIARFKITSAEFDKWYSTWR